MREHWQTLTTTQTKGRKHTAKIWVHHLTDMITKWINHQKHGNTFIHFCCRFKASLFKFYIAMQNNLSPSWFVFVVVIVGFFAYLWQLQIVISEKDNLTNTKKKLLNDNFIYWGGKNDQNLPLLWKSHCRFKSSSMPEIHVSNMNLSYLSLMTAALTLLT